MEGRQLVASDFNSFISKHKIYDPSQWRFQTFHIKEIWKHLRAICRCEVEQTELRIYPVT